MDFPMVDDKTEERFRHVFPKFGEETTELKKIASDLGDGKMVAWGKDEKRWRLYENRIPAGVDADAQFGKFATPEAEQAYMQDREQRLSDREKTAGIVKDNKPEIDASRLYYPVPGLQAAGAEKGVTEQDLFRQLKSTREQEGNPVKIDYDANVGAYVHKSGPTEGFDRWQTPEMKAAWEERGRVRSKSIERTVDRAQEVAGASDLRAQGKHFQAEYGNGFFLPGPKDQELRDRMLGELKKAPNEELDVVHKATQTELNRLERKQYAIQIQAAEQLATKDGGSFDKAGFDAASKAEKREMSGHAGLSNADFAKLAALSNGFFTMRRERQERGMEMTVADARALKEAPEKKAAPKANDEQKKSIKQEEPAKDGPKPRAKSRGAAAAAALSADMGR